MNKKAIFISTASQVILKFVTLVFTLISIKLLTNYLGTAGIGEYNTITTYLNLFLVLADLGLFSVTIREIAKDPQRERKILSTVLVIRLISALIACAVAVSIVFFTKYDDTIKYGTLIAAGFLLFNLMASIYDIALQYRLKMQYSAIAEFIARIITITALIIIIQLHGNFYWITSTIALSGILIFLFKWLFTRQFIVFPPSYDKKIAGWIFSLAWPIGIVFIVNNLFFKLDTLLLFAIKGASTVGIYSVAYKILEVTAFIGSYFASSLKPIISENIEKDKKYVGNIISKGFSIMLFISMPVTIMSAVFSKEIILFISNQDFISGAKALTLLAFTLPFIFFDILFVEVFIANDERKLLVKIAIFVLLFNLLTNLFFITKYSFMGAAFTTFLSEIVLCIINIYYTKKIVTYTFDWDSILKIILIASITFAVTSILKTTGIYFLILIAISFVLYMVLSYFLNIINHASIKEITRG